jgi:hypothetical protein
MERFIGLVAGASTTALALTIGFRQPPAYLDPGSGSYLLQLLIAGLLGSAFLIRLFWGRIRSFFVRLFSRHGGDDQGE